MSTKLDDVKKQLGAVDLDELFNEQIRYRVSTGITAFDLAIGGGIPSGKLTEFYGGESTSKSRLVLHILAETQRMGGTAMLLDVERSLEKGLVELTGLDTDTIIYPNPDGIVSAEDVLDRINLAIKVMRDDNPEGLLTIALDSLAAVPSQFDVDSLEEKGEWSVRTGAMRRAQVIGDGLKKLIPKIHASHVCLVFVNQIRDKMNVMFGDKTDTPGGRQVKFHASLRLRLRTMGQIKDDKTKERVGTKVNLFVAKSRVCAPFQEVNFEIPVLEPISSYSGLFDYFLRHSTIVKDGGFYRFADEDRKFRKKEFETVYKEKFEEEKP